MQHTQREKSFLSFLPCLLVATSQKRIQPMEEYKDFKPKEPNKDKSKNQGQQKRLRNSHLAILPGKPRCRVASIWPTSIPNSRAFVAATPQRFPPKKSLSILLLSCSVCIPTQKICTSWTSETKISQQDQTTVSYILVSTPQYKHKCIEINNSRVSTIEGYLIYLSSVSSTISTHRLNQMGCSLLKNFTPITIKRVVAKLSWNYL